MASAVVLLGAVIFTLMAAYQWAGSLGLLNAGQNGQVRALSTAGATARFASPLINRPRSPKRSKPLDLSLYPHAQHHR